MSDTFEARVKQKKGRLASFLAAISHLLDPVVPVDDRRLCGRISSDESLDFLTEAGKKGRAQLLDLSRYGLRLKTESHLAKKTTIALKAPTHPSVEKEPPLMAKVVWCYRDPSGLYISGLQVPDDAVGEVSWLSLLLEELGYSDDGSQRRKYIRAESEILGILEPETGDPTPVRVLNLSMGGALIEAKENIPSNTQFSLQLGPHLDLPGLTIEGTVLRNSSDADGDKIYHSSRFGALTDETHKVLSEYIRTLIKKPE